MTLTSRWYVCCAGDIAPQLAEKVSEIKHCDNVVLGSDPNALRAELKHSSFGVNNVVVGPNQLDMSPINIASALVLDGWAKDVVLVVDVPSGSLKSRALQAGITEVLSTEDILGTTHVAGRTNNNNYRSSSFMPQPATCDPNNTNASDSLSLSGVHRALASKVNAKDIDLYEDKFSNLDEPEGIEVVSKVAKKPDAGKLVVFVSGRGGSGKTSIVGSFGSIAYEWGMKVSLVDLDLACGNLYSYFGISDIADITCVSRMSNVCEKSVLSQMKLIDNSHDFRVLGPCERAETAEVIDDDIVNILTILQNNFDLVLVDTSNVWGVSQARAIQAADRVVFVADERAGSVASLVRTQNLALRLGVARTRFVRILNKVDRQGKDQVFLNKVNTQFSGSQTFCIDNGGLEISQIMSQGNCVCIPTLDGVFKTSTSFVLAKLLQSLGCLPEVKEANLALVKSRPKRSRRLFRRG